MRKSGFLLTFLIGSVLLLLDSCTLPPPTAREPAPDEIEAGKLKLDMQMLNLAGRYDAVRNWETQFRRLSPEASVLSVEMERALVDSAGRPVVFMGYLKDIIHEDGEYTARFESDDLDVQFRLQCSKAAADSLLRRFDRNGYNHLAGIAQIDKVRKQESVIFLYPEETDYDMVFAFETYDVFVATGRLVDYVWYGDIY